MRGENGKYQCPLCDRGFDRRWNLKCHVLIHTSSVRPDCTFKCISFYFLRKSCVMLPTVFMAYYCQIWTVLYSAKGLKWSLKHVSLNKSAFILLIVAIWYNILLSFYCSKPSFFSAIVHCASIFYLVINF